MLTVKTYSGKVRDVAIFESDSNKSAPKLVALTATDKVSAFNQTISKIPDKGAILTNISKFFFQKTADVCPNFYSLLGGLGEEKLPQNTMVGLYAEPIKLELIVRRYLTGSLWQKYNNGLRETVWGTLNDGFGEFQKFEDLLFTPTRKSANDEDISEAQILQARLLSEEELAKVKNYSLMLFLHGEKIANQNGLVLVDTKFEFGRLPNGEIILIDECLTPDSSRYWHANPERVYDAEHRPTELSKQFFRDYLASRGFTGEAGQKPPQITKEVTEELRARYYELHNTITQQVFTPTVTDDESLCIMDFVLDYYHNL
jgi:phosphoribosylaminoimidazole-succinocarboxamide synthase